MGDVVDLNKYRFEKMKKNIAPELVKILETDMGKHLYNWVYLLIRQAGQGVGKALGFYDEREQAWLHDLAETLSMTKEMTLLFVFEIFTEAIFNKKADKVTSTEIEKWIMKGE